MATTIMPFAHDTAIAPPMLSAIPSIIARIIYLFKAGKFAEVSAEAYKAELEKQTEIREALLESLTQIAMATKDPMERLYMFQSIRDLAAMWC
ncbi:MAG: hypothetical protein J5482_02200 [Oscillospiraceae bacterium]|nr:hypothetical protein [Oscillospiraceae bacterium]